MLISHTVFTSFMKMKENPNECFVFTIKIWYYIEHYNPAFIFGSNKRRDVAFKKIGHNFTLIRHFNEKKTNKQTNIHLQISMW